MSKNTETRVKIYTDGSCSPNPGDGGYGILILTNPEIEVSKRVKNTTNNIMEVTAIIEAIKVMKNSNLPLEIYSDSQYAIKCAEGIWQRKKNQELWAQYDLVAKGLDIKFVWVRGHNGDVYNEYVDRLAKGLVEGF